MDVTGAEDGEVRIIANMENNICLSWILSVPQSKRANYF